MQLDDLYGRHIEFYTDIEISLEYSHYSKGLIRICRVDGKFFTYERYIKEGGGKYLVFINGVCEVVEGRTTSWVDNLESEMAHYVIEEEEVEKEVRERLRSIDLGKLIYFTN